MNHLKEIYNNPNARVAVGKQGKKLMKKVTAAIEEEDSDSDEEAEMPKAKKAKKAKKQKKSVMGQFDELKQILAAKLDDSLIAAETKQESAYQPPQMPSYNYVLDTPATSVYPTIQVQAPTPYPVVVPVQQQVPQLKWVSRW